MKKLVCLLLSFVFVLSLCACGASKKETPASPSTAATTEPGEGGAFQVGFGRVNITPSPNTGVLLDGYDDRWSEGVLNYMFATCVAITDEQNNTLLLYTLDMCNTEKPTAEALREKLTAETGIPGDNITISGTHTHASPAEPYAANYVDLLVQAGQEALADRAPATIATGSYDVPDMNFDRHYRKNDGTMKGDNFGSSDSGYESHASVADPTMRLIRFVRKGEKKDVLMVNWQAHPKLSSTAETSEGKATRNYISADFIGFARDHVESKENVLFAYYTGAAGNVNALSHIDKNEGSPFETTFVLTVANGRDTYIPIESTWDYTVADAQIPYEVRICRYPRGTAETLAKDLGAMLTELAGK